MAKPKPRNQITPGRRPPTTRGPGRPRRHPDEKIIVDRLTIGAYFEEATASAGIHKSIAYEWLRTGRTASIAVAEGARTPSSLTRHEQRCVTFSDAVDVAEAEWMIRANLQLERLGEGGIEQVTTTEKVDENGNVIERTTKTERTLPSDRVLTWRMEKKDPQRYGRRLALEGVEDGPPVKVEQRVESIIEALAAFKQQEAS
jgi:hypothetical protein